MAASTSNGGKALPQSGGSAVSPQVPHRRGRAAEAPMAPGSASGPALLQAPRKGSGSPWRGSAGFRHTEGPPLPSRPESAQGPWGERWPRGHVLAHTRARSHAHSLTCRHRRPWGEGWPCGYALAHTHAHSLSRRPWTHVSKGEGRLSLRGERRSWVAPRETSCLLLWGPASADTCCHQVTAAAQPGCTSPGGRRHQRSMGSREVTDSPVAARPRAPLSHATWCLMTILSARDTHCRHCQGPIRGKIETLLFSNSLKQHKPPAPVIIMCKPSITDATLSV